ncbi:MAG: hypothetical protein Kow0074_08080 [Candidatus Zixiibacteriota bacterium]
MRRLVLTIILTLLALTVGHAADTWAASGTTIIPLDHDALVHQPKPDGTPGCFCPQPSTRNLLQRNRSRIAGPALRADVQIPFTLKVIAIRVQFVQEIPDDPNTTGDGTFDLRDTTTFFEENGHNFDTPPHDRRYFETHLRALNQYWNTVSNGEVTLDYTVFPVASDSAYQLPQNMSYYGRERGGDSGVVYGLEQFVIDAGTAAAADPAVIFDDYDAVIFFHAGSDRQSDIFQDTPHDLFTAFIRLGEKVSFAAGVSDVLSEAIIMPETLIQDNRITVLNSVLAHEFGHQLGLVDLYNTRNFLTQVGNFSLMDNNVADVGVDVTIEGRRRILFGALPVFPDAWSRLHLGFVEAYRVENQFGVVVPAAEQLQLLPQATPQVVQVPISETEYYLIENRRIDIDGQGDPGLRLDSVTSVVLGPADTLTLTNTREYDFLLPGQGLLIWHVDEGVAELDIDTTDDTPNNFQANTLQWDWERRFLRLIEADGLVNFGGYYSAGTGSLFDFFYQGNNSRLTAFTNPPAISNTGAVTGITIENISPPSTSMTFDVHREGPLDGFPVYAGLDTTGVGAPIVADLTPLESRWSLPGDGKPEVFVAYKNYILAWDWTGRPLGTVSVPDSSTRYDDSTIVRQLYPIAMGDPEHGEWIGPPLIADPGDGDVMIIAATKSGHVYFFGTRDADDDGLFDLRFRRDAPDPISARPIIWNRGTVTKEIFVPLRSHAYVVYGLLTGDTTLVGPLSGNIVGAAGLRDSLTAVVMEYAADEHLVGWLGGALAEVGTLDPLPPVVGDIDRDSSYDAIFLMTNGELHVIDREGEYLPGFPIDIGGSATQPPTLADVDLDGYLDIILVSDGYLHAYTRNAVLLPDFPILIGERNAPDSGATSPIAVFLATASESGNSLSLATSGIRQRLSGFDANGRTLDGFPLPLGGATPSSVAWSAIPDDNSAAVFAHCSDGFLYGYSVGTLPGSLPATTWPMFRRDARGTATIPIEDLGAPGAEDAFFIEERAFVYPNPANESAVVRYWLGDDASVRIRIYDVAGNLVAETHTSGQGGLFNEWTWDCSGAASGVYFAHIQANALTSGETATVLCKMAVVQ